MVINRSYLRVLGYFLLTTLIYSSCYWDNAEELYPDSGNCDTSDLSYPDVIKPIIDLNCAVSNCHVAGTGNPDFTSYAGLKAAVDNGSVMDRVVVKKDMPPSGPLSSCNIAKIEAWIEIGAPSN
jgi:hypothetical protein